VIAVGTPYRSDDGVGGAVLAALARQLGEPPAVDSSVHMVELDGEPVRMMQTWGDADVVWVVDAVAPDGSPGRIHELHGTSSVPDGRWSGVGGGHALGVVEAVELASALGRMPAELHVLGVEGDTFEPGEGLSPAVAAAVPAAAARLAAAIRDVTPSVRPSSRGSVHPRSS
jgi:hydrogenase maturation protease